MNIYRPTYTRNGETARSKNWVLKFQHEGKTIVKTLGTPNKAAAEARARKIISETKSKGWEVLRPTLPKSRKASLEEVVEAYRIHAAEVERKGGRVGLAPSTIALNIQRLRKIARECEVETVEDLAGALPAWKKRRGESAETKAMGLRSAASVFTSKALLFYSKQGLAVSDPFAGHFMEAPEAPPFTALGTDTMGQVKALLEAAQRDLKSKEPSQYALLLLSLCGGLRQQEAAWVLWEHLHDTGVWVASDAAAHETKSRRGRFVPLPPSVVAELRSLPQEHDLVIPPERLLHKKSKDGKRALKAAKKTAAWLRAQGIRQRQPLHYLRKLYGAIISTKHGLYAAQQYLGHSSVKITEQTYSALLEQKTVDLFS
jgi:hypothetical protein